MVSMGLTRADEIRACADRVAVCIAGASFTNYPCLLNLHPPQCVVPEGSAILVKVLPPSEDFLRSG